MRASSRGFTLVEIMIVTAVIALVCALAIPNIMRVTCAANETTALGGVRTLITAMQSWRTTHTDFSNLGSGYGKQEILGDPSLVGESGPAYIDSTLATLITADYSRKKGYNFYLWVSVNGENYYIWALPKNTNTGTRRYRYYNYDAGIYKAGTIYVAIFSTGAWSPYTPLQ